MSDSGGAAFLGQLFDFLAESPDERTKEIARWVFRNSQFDCSWTQVFCGQNEPVTALLPDVCTSCWTEGGNHDERNCEREDDGMTTDEA